MMHTFADDSNEKYCQVRDKTENYWNKIIGLRKKWSSCMFIKLADFFSGL